MDDLNDQRRLNFVSNTTSVTSLYRENMESGEEPLLGRLQQQLKAIRNENHEMVQQTSHFRRKIHQLEEEKLTLTEKLNSDTTGLKSVIARLESEVEKGEATRQSVEYELTVTKKRAKDALRNVSKKESVTSRENMLLSDQKSSLELKTEELEVALELAHKVTADNEKTIVFLEEDKKQIHSDAMAAEAILRSENEKTVEKLEEVTMDRDSILQRFEDSKSSLIKQEEDLRKAVTELQISMEREQHLRHDLDDCTRRARALEECVEAERAAHLESKFNSEIIQLKQQEFQSQLAAEREVCDVLKHEAEDANAKADELQRELEFHKKEAKSANEKLEKSVQVYADIRKQLDAELAEKTKIIEEMSVQLESHQSNLDQLKQELGKARKRQIFLDETYGGNVREMELLLENFGLQTEPRASSGKSKGSKDPKIVLERMKNTLFGYQKQVADLQHKVKNLTSVEKQTQKDCSNFRDLAVTREKELQQTQKELNECERELVSIRTQQAEYEREVKRSSDDLISMTSELEQQRQRCHQLETNVGSIQDRYSNETDIHVGFLRELLHVICNSNGESNTLTKFTWLDASLHVRDGLDSLISKFNRCNEQCKTLESSCSEMQRSIGELQKAHESSVDRLAERCREREEEAGRQRKQLEQHYEALLAEMNGRTKKTQSLCDEAWGRVRANEGMHEGLQAECAQLRGENSNMVQERSALVSACVLLLGAVYPLIRARDDLSLQCSLLTKTNNNAEICKQQMRMLVETLSEEIDGENNKRITSVDSFKFIHPLIRFRVAVVAVIAANRLKYFGTHANVSIFTCNDTAISNCRVMVVAGQGPNINIKCKSDEPTVTSQSDVVADWLTSSHLIHNIRDSTCGLVDALKKNRGDKSGYMSRALLKTAQNSFIKLMETTQPSFPHYICEPALIRDRNCLCRMLAGGLEKILRRSSLREAVNLFSVEHSFSALQRHLLGFTERLHSGELEKRNLRNEQGKLRSKIDKLKNYKSEVEKQSDEIQGFKDRERALVARSRFDGVCTELNAALEREKRAQKLLHEQNSKLQELSGKLEETTTDHAEKDMTLNQAITGLTEVKMDLKRSNQTKRELEKQVGHLQHERDRLTSTIQEAKSALKKAAGEKSSIEKYFVSVEKTLQNADDVELANKLRNHGSTLSNRAGIKAAQRAVETFVRAQSTAVSRISNLETQITSYRSHISALKRELMDACHRDNCDITLNEDIPTREKFYSHQDPLLTSSTPMESFKPLKGELVDESSFEQLKSEQRDRNRSSAIKDLTNTYLNSSQL
ncbi:coiled-coil domain-containing protein 171-like [Ciona intestinalis]